MIALVSWAETRLIPWVEDCAIIPWLCDELVPYMEDQLTWMGMEEGVLWLEDRLDLTVH